MQLPLHAAGIYTGPKQICCSDYFVASYTPSIEALLNMQRTLKPHRRTAMDTLLVAVDNPFEGAALPMAAEEADKIHHLVPSKVVRVSRCLDVLEYIQSSSILHLACHGLQNPTDALQSGFMLEDGLLTVSKLMELDLPDAFLAVLSACETAKGDAAQPDQAVHLAAAMLFAGFKSVVCGESSLVLYRKRNDGRLKVYGRSGRASDRGDYLLVSVQH
jgi:CHAT domain-containing protein